MVSSTAVITIITYLLVLSSTLSQTGGFLSPKRRKATERKKSTKMNEASQSQSSLFSPTSKYHHNQNGLAKRRRWLIVDFDGTCTEHDTTPLLPRLAAFATRSRSSISKASDGTDTNNNEDYDHQEDLKKRLDQFQLLEDEFMKRYNEARSQMFNSESDESSKSLYDVLDALDEPSNAVTEMVSASKCLSGLGHADTDEVEGMLNLKGVTRETTLENANISESHFHDKVTVRLRHGCESTLSRILLDDKASLSKDDCEEDDHKCYGWRLAVLSINWSPKLIDACLVQPVLRRRRSLLRIESCDTEVPIWSNEVDREGVVTLHVPGALAKRDRLIELKKYIKQGCDQTQSIIVYVGDSSTDLAALLVADMGIVMGNSSSLITIAESWGIMIAPLKNRHEHGFQRLLSTNANEEPPGKKILYQTDTWQEIDEALQEIDEHWTS